MKENKSRFLAYNGILAAVYFILTLINPISFGNIQFRISTLLITLPFFIPSLKWGIYGGVIISNFFSPLGFIDVLAGFLIQFIQLDVGTRITKNNYLRSLIYSIAAGLIVGYELYIIYSIPFLINAVSVFISSLILSEISVLFLTKYQSIIFKNINLN